MEKEVERERTDGLNGSAPLRLHFVLCAVAPSAPPLPLIFLPNATQMVDGLCLFFFFILFYFFAFIVMVWLILRLCFWVCILIMLEFRDVWEKDGCVCSRERREKGRKEKKSFFFFNSTINRKYSLDML